MPFGFWLTERNAIFERILGHLENVGPKPMAEQQIRFDDGAAYERMMGNWSRLAGDMFLDWLAPRSGLRWIDIGCGNGAFTELLVERCAPAEIQGVDPSEAQLTFARARPAARVAKFRQGDAMALPFSEDRFDAAVMALVLFFVPDPAKGVAEMMRVVCPGGTVANYVWDMLGGGVPLEPIQVEMRAMGVTPLLPPRTDASRMEALRGLVDGCGPRCGRDAGNHGATDIRRFRRLLDDHPTGVECWPDYRRDGSWRYRAAQNAGAQPPASGCRGAHHLWCTR
jgi:ubiquinone/menaquinone biosynthesis C-methylase UbiE